MCGYAQRMRAIPKAQRYLEEWGINEALPMGRFWPGTTMTGVIIESAEQGIHAIDAIWWFLLAPKDGQLKPDRKITCFNARNLDGRLWKSPFKTSRCLIPVSAIVETKGKQSYLMEAEGGAFLGGLYRTWGDGAQQVHSCSVITCPPPPRFSEYHDKSIPLFMPLDDGILRRWLDPTFHEADFFRGMIDTPGLPYDFTVAPVKNSQHVEPLGEFEVLGRDQ
jgi:putative SOS response-associated peptidase YedK